MSEELQRNAGTLAVYVKQQPVVKRFEEVLGPKQTPIFLSALIAYGSKDQLKNCEPQTIVTAAMQSVVLNLPLALGFSHIVPYGNKAQFQVSYTGYVQLAKRTGQYKDINAEAVNKDMFKGYNEIGSPMLDWTAFDSEQPIIGYMAGFMEVNGAVKVIFWTKEKVLTHAKRYSKAYQYDLSAGKKTSKWSTDFDAMAKKTVLKNLLTKWAMLSIEMKQALDADQGIIGEDGAIVYPDSAENAIPIAAETVQQPTGSRTDAATATLQAKRKAKQAKPDPVASTPPDPVASTPPEPNKAIEVEAETVVDAPEAPDTDKEEDKEAGFFD